MTENVKDPIQDGDTFEQEFQAVELVSRALMPLNAEARQRVVKAVLSLIGGGSFLEDREVSFSDQSKRVKETPFSEDRSMSPKEFILQKQPSTDVERIACLAYYLTHYKDTPHFKTLEISKLNTEAAQRKFSNPAKTMGNAVNYGYIVPASKGQRQLSATGEQFVQALPDRVAAKHAMSAGRPKRKKKQQINKKKKIVSE